MAIKFEAKKDGDNAAAARKAKGVQETIEARFATPIATDQPVNPDAGSELPFGKLPRAEKKGRKGR